MTAVPTHILRQVEGAIMGLREIAQRLADNRAMDQRLGSAGRYESEAHANRAGDIAHCHGVLEKFAAAARARGIDPVSVYAGFGGVPDILLSPAAHNYMNSGNPEQKGK